MTPEEERDFLLDHVRRPRHVGEIPESKNVGECRNPACGDQVKVWLTFSHTRLTDVKIKASGCTICVASASLMAELVHQRDSSELGGLISLMQTSMRSPNTEWPLELGSLSPLKRMRESPMKLPCVLVSWVALEKAIAG